MLQDDLAKLIISLVFFTTGQPSCRIDRACLTFPPPRHLAIKFIHRIGGILHVAPSSAQVKILEGKPYWIKLDVTYRAFGILSMKGHQFPWSHVFQVPL